jgi:replicative DNA helicase
MDKIEIKKKLEEKFLSLMLSDLSSIPVIAGKIKSEQLCRSSKKLFDEIISLSNWSYTDPSFFAIALSKRDIDLSLTEILIMQSEGRNYSIEKFISNNAFESFYDIVYSLQAEKFLTEKLKSARENTCGLDLLIDLQNDISGLLKTSLNLTEEKSFSRRIHEILERKDNEINSPQAGYFNTMDFPSFNNAIGGLRPSNFVVIAGSFKGGKSTFALNLMLSYAKKDIPCGIFSLELSEEEMDDKILSMLSCVPYELVRNPKKLTSGDKECLNGLILKPVDIPVYITDKRLTETEIFNKAKYWKERFGVKIICIDYLGYIRSKKKFDSRERELTYYSEQLKGMAKELGIAVIALAQLNRQGRISPIIDNLAESIGAARDADFIFTIYSPREAKIERDGNGYAYKDNDFVVSLQASRHTKSKGNFILSLKDTGNFVEIATEYDNEYLESKIVV